MSLLSSFVTTQLLKALETQFVAHEPDIQNAFAQEVHALSSTIMSWANNKLNAAQVNTTSTTQS